MKNLFDYYYYNCLYTLPMEFLGELLVYFMFLAVTTESYMKDFWTELFLKDYFITIYLIAITWFYFAYPKIVEKKMEEFDDAVKGVKTLLFYSIRLFFVLYLIYNKDLIINLISDNFEYFNIKTLMNKN